MKDQNFLIFTDLDGTLLDHNTYQYSEAMPALQIIKKKKIPLIFSSSKTRVEMLEYRHSMGIEDYPYIVENGSAVFSNPNYFQSKSEHISIENLDCYKFGKSYREIVVFLEHVSKKYDYKIYGFHNSSIDEIIQRTQLNKDAVILAKQREFSVPLFYDDKTKNILDKETKNYNLRLLFGGRFIHVLGNTDKGKALQFVTRNYKKKYPSKEFKTIAIGDTLNDVAMLKQADIKILVKRYNNEYDDRIQIDNLVYSPYIGPRGWKHSILEIINSGD